LHPSTPATGKRGSARLFRARPGRSPRSICVPADRICGDAGTCSPPHDGTQQGRSFEGPTGIETTRFQEFAPERSRRRSVHPKAFLAKAVLRFQCLERREDHGKIELYAFESREERASGSSERLGMEQLVPLYEQRVRIDCDRPMGRADGHEFKPAPLKTTRVRHP